MRTMQAAIFDLDGVIVDTAKYHYLAWKRLAGELGFDFAPEDNERLKGVSRMRSLAIILEIGGIRLSEAEQAEWAARKNAWYLEYIGAMTPAEILPGVVPFLNRLRQRGIKTALASASKNAGLILEKLGIGPLFDAVVDGNAVAKAKPDPEVFVTAAARLGVPAGECVVFEDAVAGIAAARGAGMAVIGIGDPRILTEADLVIADFTRLNEALLTGEPSDAALLIREEGFRPERIELNGSKFVLGNGYAGYRGTLEEDGAAEQAACTLAGLYDRRGEAWREPVNAPNGFYTVLHYEGQRLAATALPPREHCQEMDMSRGLHRRTTRFAVEDATVAITAERFLSLADPHLLALEYRFRADRSGRVLLETGIDAAVWDINGPHLAQLALDQRDGQLLAEAVTNEGESVAVAEAWDWDGPCTVVEGERNILRRVALAVEAGREYCFHKYVSIFTAKDGVPDPAGSALAHNREARGLGYQRLRLRHAQLWHERWLRAEVRIDGDPAAQLALRYSIYLLLSAAPAHSGQVSIPGRGLSGQTYKGAIFWDTELFMLPFFDYTHPELARNLVLYRCHTLAGARRKAAEYGYEGAFYAWESQERGDDACTLFNVTDVFTGRPMRTYFRDKQIHISAAVAHAIWQYCRISGDRTVLLAGGAEAILECAQFFHSHAYFKPAKNRYELLEVTGPDEYHERVANNAYTNAMARRTFRIARELLEWLQTEEEEYGRALLAKLRIADGAAFIADMAERLYVPAPDPGTLLIEQFDGYFRLEDVTLAELKSRMKHPHEYLGGGNGLATTTRILKQADVVALLNLFKEEYSQDVKRANWEYYEPRTEHGSSLSPCVYAMLAADIGKPDWAYPYFMKTATLDLNGDYKRFVGTLYIGGTHPAANGGAWMAAVLGFGGLHCDGETIRFKPALPSHWQGLSFHFQMKGDWFAAEITPQAVQVTAAAANRATVRVTIAGQTLDCAPGQTVTVHGEFGRGGAEPGGEAAAG
jgi:nigerose phosphorylase